MGTLRTGLYAAGRVRYGAAILAAGESVDVTPVRTRYDAFAAEHYAYLGTHGTVQAARATLRQRRAVVEQLDLKQDEAVERVAQRLVADGHTRANPFAAYGLDAPSALMALNFGDKAAALHTLAGVVETDPTLAQPTRRALDAAEAAARAMETELIPFETQQTTLRTARAAREVAGQQWDKALKALKHDVRAADTERGLGLEAALLEPPKRSKKTVKAVTAGKQPPTADKQQTPGDEPKTAGDKQETTDNTATPAAAPAAAATPASTPTAPVTPPAEGS